MMSMSPSPSISATLASKAPSALVAMLALVQVGSAAPSFSNQSIASSSRAADTISKSPSPSMSATLRPRAPSTFVAISAAVQLGFAAPSCSYQAMVLSVSEAETISRSPSPSISATSTEYAPFALVTISAAVQVGLAAPLFSYQAMVSSPEDAETMSRSPSASMSATTTSAPPFAFVAMLACEKPGLAAPSFSNQATVLSLEELTTISRSPSLSMSARKTSRAASDSPWLIVVPVKEILSSSVMVRVPVASLMVAFEALDNVIVAVSLFSGALSASTGTVKVAVVSPGSKVSVPLAAV